MTVVNVMGGAIDPRRALKERWPPLRVLERERPSHPEQVLAREVWEQRREHARQAARAQVEDADRFIARMEQHTDQERRQIEAQIAAYAARRYRQTGGTATRGKSI